MSARSPCPVLTADNSLDRRSLRLSVHDLPGGSKSWCGPSGIALTVKKPQDNFQEVFFGAVHEWPLTAGTSCRTVSGRSRRAHNGGSTRNLTFENHRHEEGSSRRRNDEGAVVLCGLAKGSTAKQPRPLAVANGEVGGSRTETIAWILVYQPVGLLWAFGSSFEKLVANSERRKLSDDEAGGGRQWTQVLTASISWIVTG